jgi:hypothetical protein
VKYARDKCAFWKVADAIRVRREWIPIWTGYERSSSLMRGGQTWNICHKIIIKAPLAGTRPKVELNLTIWPPDKLARHRIDKLKNNRWHKDIVRSLVSPGYAPDYVSSDTLGAFSNFSLSLTNAKSLVRELQRIEKIANAETEPESEAFDPHTPSATASRESTRAQSPLAANANFWNLADYLRCAFPSYKAVDGAFRLASDLRTRTDSKAPCSLILAFEISIHPQRNTFSPPFIASVLVHSPLPPLAKERFRSPHDVERDAQVQSPQKAMLLQLAQWGFHGRWREHGQGLLGKFDKFIWRAQEAQKEVQKLPGIHRELLSYARTEAFSHMAASPGRRTSSRNDRC